MKGNTFMAQLAQFATPEKGQKFGIENLKGFVAYVADAIDAAADALNDNRITFIEALGLTPTIIKGTRLIANLPLISKELLDLDSSEKDELIKQLADLPYFGRDSWHTILARINAAADMVLGAVKMIEAAKRFKAGTLVYDNNGFAA